MYTQDSGLLHSEPGMPPYNHLMTGDCYMCPGVPVVAALPALLTEHLQQLAANMLRNVVVCCR